jgi:hypothetical protein
LGSSQSIIATGRNGVEIVGEQAGQLDQQAPAAQSAGVFIVSPFPHGGQVTSFGKGAKSN